MFCLILYLDRLRQQGPTVTLGLSFVANSQSYEASIFSFSLDFFDP